MKFKSKNRDIKQKIRNILLLCGLVPLALFSLSSYLRMKSSLTEQIKSKSAAELELETKVLNSYFKSIKGMIEDYSHMDLTVDAVQDFSKHMDSMNSPTNTEIQKLKNFYKNTFVDKYNKDNTDKISVNSIFNDLSKTAMKLQYDYIVDNSNELGSKHLLISKNNGNNYDVTHKKIHKAYKKVLENFNFYDIFLIDNKGRIVYSVYKETDFGTSLYDGPWQNSGLAKAAIKSLTSNKRQVNIEDYENYGPSYNQPASFLSIPILDESGKVVGALAVQIPTDEISKLVKTEDEKDNFLIFNSNKIMINPLDRNPEKYNIKAHMNNENLISKEYLSNYVNGNNGNDINKSIDGSEVIITYDKIDVLGLEWYLVNEINSSYLKRKLNVSLIEILLAQLLTSAIVTYVAYKFSNNVYNTLKDITDKLGITSSELGESSNISSSSATELSEAATEQAANLQETMASVEEISAMVSQNTETAVKAHDFASINKKASEDGSNNVEKMKVAIDDIKTTNDKIMEEVEQSNSEFKDIVKIISDIGEKTKVINDIVFQTKLLSLNASVEAARAGEYGRGFAVVAEEVGNLAQMSGTAAKEITDMLSNSIEKVDSIVQNTSTKISGILNISKEKVELGLDTSEKCSAALNEIKENATKVSDMFVEISNASKEQSQGVQEINKAISQLDIVTQKNSSVAQNSSKQAEELKLEAEHLVEYVDELLKFINGDTLNVESEQQDKSQNKNLSAKKEYNNGSNNKSKIPEEKVNNTKNSNNDKPSNKKDLPDFEDF